MRDIENAFGSTEEEEEEIKMATDAEGRKILPKEFAVDELRVLLYRARELARRSNSGQEEEHLLELHLAVMRYLRWQEREVAK